MVVGLEDRLDLSEPGRSELRAGDRPLAASIRSVLEKYPGAAVALGQERISEEAIARRIDDSERVV